MANDAVIPVNETPAHLSRADAIARAVGVPRASFDGHRAAAIEAANAAIRDANRGKPAREQRPELAPAAVASLVERFPDATVRGLVHHARTRGKDADLAAWRRDWPGAFGALSDEDAGALVRLATRLADDPAVMPETLPQPERPVAASAPSGSPAIGGFGSGPGMPIRVDGGR